MKKASMLKHSLLMKFDSKKLKDDGIIKEGIGPYKEPIIIYKNEYYNYEDFQGIKDWGLTNWEKIVTGKYDNSMRMLPK